MILVGIVALIFLGPRKLPELAKKAGKIMAEFRGTASEFKQTWEKEVNFEEEAKALSLNSVDEEPVARDDSSATSETTPTILEAPAISAADPERFQHLIPNDVDIVVESETAEAQPENDKKNWL